MYEISKQLVTPRVGQDHVHYEVLTKIFQFSFYVVIPTVESNKSYNNYCIMTIDDHGTASVDVKVMTTTTLKPGHYC